MSALLDTHAVLWYLEDSPELSTAARTFIEQAIRDSRDVYVSTISLVETIYLVERNRLPTDTVASEFEARMSIPRVLRRVSVAT